MALVGFGAAALVALRADAGEEPQAVSFQLGAAEFHGGDALAISEVRCDAPALRPGATCEVRGRYTLASAARATLLFSVTETAAGSPARRRVDPRARVSLGKGEGEFSLRVRLIAGYPHLTFYGEDGEPISGVYFGEGNSLLRSKSWRYDSRPGPSNDRLDQ